MDELEDILPSQNRMIDINEQLLPVNEFENSFPSYIESISGPVAIQSVL